MYAAHVEGGLLLKRSSPNLVELGAKKHPKAA